MTDKKIVIDWVYISKTKQYKIFIDKQFANIIDSEDERDEYIKEIKQKHKNSNKEELTNDK